MLATSTFSPALHHEPALNHSSFVAGHIGFQPSIVVTVDPRGSRPSRSLHPEICSAADHHQSSMNSQHPHGGSGGAPYDREREMEERHRAIQQHEEISRREERERERERERDRERESNHRFQSTPHHSSSAGSIPIHQPVASRTNNPIHSPGGILNNYNGGASNAPIGGGGVPPSSEASFGGPLPQSEQHGRQPQHGGQGGTGSQHQMFAPMPQSQSAAAGSQNRGPNAAAAAVFGGPLQGQTQNQQHQQQETREGQVGSDLLRVATPRGHPASGQQPILNVSASLLLGRRLADLQESARLFYCSEILEPGSSSLVSGRSFIFGFLFARRNTLDVVEGISIWSNANRLLLGCPYLPGSSQGSVS